MNGRLGNVDVAPHGIIAFAAFALLLIIGIHLLGFRIVGAVRLGR